MSSNSCVKTVSGLALPNKLTKKRRYRDRIKLPEDPEKRVVVFHCWAISAEEYYDNQLNRKK